MVKFFAYLVIFFYLQGLCRYSYICWPIVRPYVFNSSVLTSIRTARSIFMHNSYFSHSHVVFDRMPRVAVFNHCTQDHFGCYPAVVKHSLGIKLNTKTTTVNIDRLKPAFIDVLSDAIPSEQPVFVPSPPSLHQPQSPSGPSTCQPQTSDRLNVSFKCEIICYFC